MDPEARLDLLKRRVADYPEALRRAVVQDSLWAAEFGLGAFARKFAARADAYGRAACLTCAVNQLVQARAYRRIRNQRQVLVAFAEIGPAARPAVGVLKSRIQTNNYAATLSIIALGPPATDLSPTPESPGKKAR